MYVVNGGGVLFFPLARPALAALTAESGERVKTQY